jgi:hypothetical protein
MSASGNPALLRQITSLAFAISFSVRKYYHPSLGKRRCAKNLRKRLPGAYNPEDAAVA